jgi:hypothetical protein
MSEARRLSAKEVSAAEIDLDQMSITSAASAVKSSWLRCVWSSYNFGVSRARLPRRRPDQPEDALGSKDGTVFRTGAAPNGAGPEARWGDRGRLSSQKELGESAKRAGNVQASQPVPAASPSRAAGPA